MEDATVFFKHVIDDSLLNISQTPPTPPTYSNISYSTPVPTSTIFDPTSHVSMKHFEIHIFNEETITYVSKTTPTIESPP